MYQTHLKLVYKLNLLELTYFLETIESLVDPKVKKKKDILNRETNVLFNRQN